MYNKSMEKLNYLIKQIKKYNPDALCVVVDDKSFKEPFLLVSTNNIKQKIMLFDGNTDLEQFAEISYSRPTKGMILATFEVDEEHQQQGFGRFLFNLACAQADILGCHHLAGTAHPTAPIKGVSSEEHDIFEQEQQVIIDIYKKLDCTFADDSTFFEQHWTNGDKIKNANPLTQELAYKIAETYGVSPPNQMQ